MPCRDYEDSTRTITVSDPADRKLINKLTSMLCSTLTIMFSGTKTKLPTEVLEWWQAHKKFDKKDGRPHPIKSVRSPKHKKK